MMSENEQSLSAEPTCPPPLPSSFAAKPPTPWKKILLIVGLSLFAALGFVILIGALLFGGCMWLIQQAGH